MEFESVIEFISPDTCVSYKLNSGKLDAEETISKYWTVNDAGRFGMKPAKCLRFFCVFICFRRRLDQPNVSQPFPSDGPLTW